jgi:hypothetical protein
LKLLNYYDNMKLLFENSYFNNTVVRNQMAFMEHLDFEATIHYIGGEPA